MFSQFLTDEQDWNDYTPLKAFQNLQIKPGIFLMYVTFDTLSPYQNKIRELHFWHSLLIFTSYMELRHQDRHSGRRLNKCGFFSFCIKHLPIQPQLNLLEEKHYQLCSTPAGVGLLACCGHNIHLCIFFFFKGGRNGYCHYCCKAHCVLEAVQG